MGSLCFTHALTWLQVALPHAMHGVGGRKQLAELLREKMSGDSKRGGEARAADRAGTDADASEGDSAGRSTDADAFGAFVTRLVHVSQSLGPQLRDLGAACAAAAILAVRARRR